MTSSSAKHRRPREHCRFVTRLLTTVSALALFAAAAAANPQGGSVVGGAATIVETTPGNLEIRQATDKAIINWQSFSIGETERTHFAQPNASAIALNRVIGGDPSHILGRLSATGQIVLVNPNGVLFGPNATIDVAGPVATTSYIRNQDFMAGRLHFRQPGRPGATVVNRGQITVRDGGLAALVAPGVENSGEIVARLGNVTLASGDQFTVDLFGDGLISLTIGDSATSELVAADGQILTASIVNSGRVAADGGQVLLTTATARNIVDRSINMNGVIEAHSFVQQEGRIILFGGDAGEVRVAGALDVSGENAAQGGRIDVFGEEIILAGEATLDASGGAGGGFVRVGGDYRGQGEAPVSAATEIQAGAAIRADATGTGPNDIGNGGRIILWSDGTTSYYGTTSARGGTAGGDGGFVEVSGKQQLAFAGTVDTRASNGRTGQLLLDPTSVDICRRCTTGGAGTPSSRLNVNDLVANLNTNNVTVSTTSTAAGGGDIDVNARVRWSSGNNLTLSADRNITLSQNLEARAQSDITLHAGIGGAGNLSMSAGRQISTIGGAVEVQGTRVTLQRVTTRAGGTIANGGNVTVNAGTGGVELLQQIDARASRNRAGSGGAVKVTASGDIAVNRNIYTEAYTGNAGAITLTSTNGAISTVDNAVLLARGLRGGNGGTVTLRADNGGVTLGATAGNGTRIYTRGQGTGASGNGGNVILAARSVTLNRGINTDGSVSGSGGDVTITATAGNVTTQNIIARGGSVAGSGGAVKG